MHSAGQNTASEIRPGSASIIPQLPPVFPSQKNLSSQLEYGRTQGDTQPISQSVFEEIIKRGAYHRQEESVTNDVTHSEEVTLLTLHEGDPGHLNLLSGFAGTEAQNETSDQDQEDATSKVGESSPSQYRPNIFPESQRFVNTTPATAKTRVDHGDVVMATPPLPRIPLVSDVGSTGGIIALSQAFKPTQALSSPFIAGLLSEPISDRPSPNIPIQNRPVSLSLDSPSHISRPTIHSGFAGPQLNYVTMKESQAKREKLAEERRTRSADNIHSSDLYDSDFEREPSFIQRIKRQKKIDADANRKLANLSAPARPTRRRGKTPLVSKPSSSPERHRRDPSSDPGVSILDVETQGETVPSHNGGTSEEETEQEDCIISLESPPQQVQSTEEDKENFDGPPLTVAHDRLSLAIDLQEAILVHDSAQAETHGSTLNVQDSQTSSRQEHSVKCQTVPPRHPGFQADLSSDAEKVYSSPLPEPPVPSSPPKSKSPEQPAGEDDDDLPPQYDTDRVGHAAEQPFVTARILSSPSGRQRRALTEIAADASPKVFTSPGGMDINILSAEDREFRSLVGSTPVRPKKRRIAGGRKMIASDPAPATPGPLAPQFEECSAQDDVAPNKSRIAKTNSVQSQRPEPRNRTDIVCEVDISAQNPPSNGGSNRASQLSDTRSSQSNRLSKPPVLQCVLIQNSSSPTPISQSANLNQVQAEAPSQGCSIEPQSSPAYDGKVHAPNQVLAFWNGIKRAYYPAVCLGMSGSPTHPRYLVKFEDSFPVEVPAGSVKRLELRIGDVVKVDMPNVPKITHIVRGFSDKLSVEVLNQRDESSLVPVTDIHGYSTIILAAKRSKSVSNGRLHDSERTIKAPVSRIYLDMILWNQLRDRQFSYSLHAGGSATGLQTPTRHNSTPISPNSRLYRGMVARTGLFSGMAFAVSYLDEFNSKSRVIKLILKNGGRILGDGFEELFELPTNIHTPAKSPASMKGEEPFRLVSGAETTGFTCLIADKHSRRAKYMQALALNIPCLSGRWVEDCVRENTILSWEMYLLPAGESAYLSGAIKSRILSPTSAVSAKFTDTIASRPKLLGGQSVLIVMGRGKSEEKRKAFIFLAYAMGASRVERVLDLTAAKSVLMEKNQEHDWDWLHVDDDDEYAAKELIFGATSAGSRKGVSTSKRKRKRGMDGFDHGSGTGKNNPRIVGNEFFCQILILGKVVDELQPFLLP